MKKKLLKAIAGCAALCFVSGMIIVSGNSNDAVAAGDVICDYNFDDGFTEDKEAGLYGNSCTVSVVEGMNSNYGGVSDAGNCIKISNRNGYWENSVLAYNTSKLTVGQKYTVTFDIYHENAETEEYSSNRACIIHTMPDYFQYGQPNTAPYMEWERISVDFTYEAAKDFMYFEFAYPEATQANGDAYKVTNKEEYYIDNFSIKEYVAPTEAPAATPTQEAPAAPEQQQTAPEQPVTITEEYLDPGYTEVVKGIVYEVINNDTVAVVEFDSPKAKLTIPATIVLEEHTYKVTTIKDKAFQKDEDIKNLTIGENVTSIGKSAFFKCSSLKKITIKSSAITSIGKKAFKGVNKKVSVKVPKAKKAAYKKLLKKAGIPAKAKIK